MINRILLLTSFLNDRTPLFAADKKKIIPREILNLALTAKVSTSYVSYW